MSSPYKLPEYTIYFDTSIAYSKKPSEAISGKTVKCIEDARTRTTINVRVPEVVLEELTYQQVLIAQSAGESLKKNSKTLTDVCGADAAPILDAAALEAGVRKLLSKLTDKMSIAPISTPIADIDWKAVVQDSCWRRPPFEKPKSADDLAEKGFRDRIILETIKIDAAKVTSGVIAFVAADNLLRTTFEDQAKSQCPIEAYRNFEEFLGHLDLLAKTQSSRFTSEVMSKVESIFYNPNDPNCVATSQGVIKHLFDRYADEMSRPSLLPTVSSDFGKSSNPWSTISQPVAGIPMLPPNWFEESTKWTPVTPIKLFGSPPVFQPGTRDRRYHWISTVTLVRLLRRTEPRFAGLLREDRIRMKEINVAWSCQIDPSTAQFSDYSVENYIQAQDCSVEAEWHLRAQYDLPMFAGSDVTNTDPSDAA